MLARLKNFTILSFFLWASYYNGFATQKSDDQELQLLIQKARELSENASNRDSVNTILDQAEILADGFGNQHELVNILIIRGQNEYFSGNYEDAVSNYYMALDIAEKINDSNSQAKLYHKLGMVYDELEDFDEAISYFQKSLEFSQTTKDSLQIAKTFQNLAICYQNKKDLNQSLEFIEKANKWAIRSNDTTMIIDLTNNLGTVYYDQKKLDESLAYYRKALDLYLKSKDSEGIAYSYNNIGLVYLDKGDFKVSLEYFMKSLALANEFNLYDFKADIYSNLTIYYKEIKDYENAFLYYDKYNTVYDSLAGDKKNKMIRLIQAKYQLGKKTREIEDLQDKNKTQLDKIDNARSFQSYLIIITLLVISLMIATFYFLFKEKKLAAELKAKTEELKELNISKDKLFSIIAHDLKNPFNVLVSYTSLLKSDLELFSTEELKKIISDLNQASENGFNLLQNMLHWTRTKTNRIHIFKTSFNLAEVIEGVRALVELNLISKDQKFTIDVDPEIMVFADKDMISAVVRNLVFNAMKFSPKGSEIKLKATKTASGLIIDVIDSGVGIPKESIEKLFRIDTNVTQQGTDGETGTGLGLVLCREFVEKHGGKIWVESEVAQGSVFSFTLPEKHS